MVSFSKSFGSNHSQATLDFVDIDPDEDIPLFFDPYVFEDASDPFFVKCNTAIKSYFDRLLFLVRSGDQRRAEEILNYLREPNELCFGLSTGRPSGRGIGRGQANQMYQSFVLSEAATSGLLNDLAECELFVSGIGPDKISDMAANIIRKHLIEYTQQQCALHGFPLTSGVPSGPLWDEQQLRWTQSYVDIPVVKGRPILLVPKKLVRWRGDLSHQHKKYYDHFVLNFLKDHHLQARDRFVHLLKDGTPRVYKTELAEAPQYELSKDFLFRFSRDNPAVLARYQEAYRQTKGVEVSELEDGFDEATFVKTLKKQLAEITPGTKQANDYHRLMIGILEYLFYPNLAYPVPEQPINQGRKRIDIVYTNAAKGGFWARIASHHDIPSQYIMVECKNYESDVANPEFDQLVGRFSANRGRVGILVSRTVNNADRYLARCRDITTQSNGYVLALVDADIVTLLDYASTFRRSLIDDYLENRFRQLLM